MEKTNTPAKTGMNSGLKSRIMLFGSIGVSILILLGLYYFNVGGSEKKGADGDNNLKLSFLDKLQLWWKGIMRSIGIVKDEYVAVTGDKKTDDILNSALNGDQCNAIKDRMSVDRKPLSMVLEKVYKDTGEITQEQYEFIKTNLPDLKLNVDGVAGSFVNGMLVGFGIVGVIIALKGVALAEFILSVSRKTGNIARAVNS